MHKKLVLISLIFIGLWIIFGSQLIYSLEKSQYSSTCREYKSTVILWRQLDDKNFTQGNGIYLGGKYILTNKHLADKRLSIVSNRGLEKNLNIEKLVLHKRLDLAILVLSRELDVPIASFEVDTKDDLDIPYSVGLLNQKESVFVGNNFLPSDRDQFMKESGHNTYIFFNNDSTTFGYSGAPLLDKKCNVFGLVSGGNNSFLLGLNKKSYFVNLKNTETNEWIEKVTTRK